MPTTTNITTTYAGQKAGAIFRETFLSTPTLDQGLVTFKPNIAFQEVVTRGVSSGLIADATCDFTPVGTVTLDERVLTPKELQVNLEFCKKTFEDDWMAIEMGVSAWKNPPSSFTAFITAEVMESVASDTEEDIWQGDTANPGEFDGFLKLLKADANVIDVDSAGVVISSANVKAEFTKVVNAIPTKVYQKRREDLVLAVSSSAMRAYLDFLGGYGASGLGSNGYKGQGNNQIIDESPVYFNGVRVVEVAGLPDNEMVAYRTSNFWFGTGLLGDWNKISIKDMEEVDLSQNFRVAMRWKAGVQYGFGGEVVYYWDAP